VSFFRRSAASLESFLTGTPCHGPVYTRLRKSRPTGLVSLSPIIHQECFTAKLDKQFLQTTFFSSCCFPKRTARFWLWFPIPVVASYFTTLLSTRLHHNDPLILAHGLILGTCSGSMTVWSTFGDVLVHRGAGDNEPSSARHCYELASGVV